MPLRAIVPFDFAESSQNNTKGYYEHRYLKIIFSKKLVKGVNHKDTDLLSFLLLQELFVTQRSQRAAAMRKC